MFYRVVKDGGDQRPVPLRRTTEHNRSEYKQYVGVLVKPKARTRAALLSWHVKWLPTKQPKNGPGNPHKPPTIVLRDDVEAIKYLAPNTGETVIWRSQNGDPDFYGRVAKVPPSNGRRAAQYNFEIHFPGLPKPYDVEKSPKWVFERGRAPMNMFHVVSPAWSDKRIETENAARVSRPPLAVPANNILQRSRIIKSAQNAILKDIRRGAGPLVVARNLKKDAARARIRLVRDAMEKANKGWVGDTGDIGGDGDNGILLEAFTNRRGLATIRHLIPSSMEYRRQQSWWKAYRQEMTTEVWVKKRRVPLTAAEWVEWKKRRQEFHENSAKTTLEKMLNRKFYQDIEIKQLASVIGTRIHQYLNVKLLGDEEDEGDEGDEGDEEGDEEGDDAPRTPPTRRKPRRTSRSSTDESGSGATGRSTGRSSDDSDESSSSAAAITPKAVEGTWARGVKEDQKVVYIAHRDERRLFRVQNVVTANSGLVITKSRWELINNKGDGNCLFLAFAECLHALENIEVDPATIREAVTKFMLGDDAKEYYMEHFEYDHAALRRPHRPHRKAAQDVKEEYRKQKVRDFNAYMDFVSRPGNDATELELQALVAMPLDLLGDQFKDRKSYNIMVFRNNAKAVSRRRKRKPPPELSWVLQDGYRLPQNHTGVFIAIHTDAGGGFSGTHYQALISKRGMERVVPDINARFAPIGVSAAPTGPISTLTAKLPRRGTAEWNGFVKAMTSLTEEGKLLKLMAKATLHYLQNLKGFEIVAMELPVIDMHQAFNMGSSASPKIVFLESRVDFLATMDGKLILGDFKNRIGNGTQYDKPHSDSIAQLVLYAWLMWTNFAITVEELWLLATNRRGEVMCFKFPFAGHMDKGGAFSRSGRRRVAEGMTGRRDVKEWLAAYTSNENVRIANESFYYAPTDMAGETVVPARLDGQSELIEQLFDNEVQYDRSIGPQRLQGAGAKKYMRGYTWEEVNWGRSKMWHRVKAKSGVPGPHREPLGLYAMFDPSLGQQRRRQNRPRGTKARVDARFQLYQDTEDDRNADAGWSVYPGARRIGKQHGSGGVDRGVISVSGYEEERPGVHHTARMKLWNLVNATALDIVAAWELDDDNDDAYIVAFCKQLEIGQRGATLSTHVARALNSSVDRELMVYMRANGTIRDDVAFNPERSHFTQNTEFPYSADRFSDFEHMSQRVAWSTAMLGKAIKLVPSCKRGINDEVDKGGKNDIFIIDEQ